MSIRDDIQQVKEELTSEEKFFEKSVITERFMKKYKKVLIALVLAIIFFVAGNIFYDINKQSTIDAANEALTELELNPSNTEILSRLESLSPDLHDLFVYSKAILDKDIQTLEGLASSEDALLLDLVTYELAQNKKSEEALSDYALQENAVYKDLAQVQAALILLNEDKIQLAHEKLKTIDANSPLYKVAKSLSHYGVQ